MNQEHLLRQPLGFSLTTYLRLQLHHLCNQHCKVTHLLVHCVYLLRQALRVGLVRLLSLKLIHYLDIGLATQHLQEVLCASELLRLLQLLGF